MSERRRVQRSGATTLTVSLPSDWVETVGLAKGDEVLVTATGDGGLVVRPSGEAGPRRMAIALDPRALPRPEDVVPALRALYGAGWERFLLRDAGGLDPALVAAVRAEVANLPGLEVLSDTGEELELAASLDPRAFPVPAVLRRLELTGATALRDTMEALRTRDVALAEASNTRALDGERLRRLALRQVAVAAARPGLARELTGTLRQALLMRESTESLAAICRHTALASLAVRDVATLEVPVDPALLDAVEHAYAIVERVRLAATGALLGRDPLRAMKALAEEESALEPLRAALRATEDTGPPLLGRRMRQVVRSLDNIVYRAGEVAEDALEVLASEPTRLWSPRDPGDL